MKRWKSGAGILLAIPLILLHSPDTHVEVFPANLSFPPPGAQDLERGYIEDKQGTPVSVCVNIVRDKTEAWHLDLCSDDPFFVPLEREKPHYHLLWKLNDRLDSQYRPLSMEPQLVVSGRGSERVQVAFRFLVSWEDAPASYHLNLKFCLRSVKRF